MTNPIEQAIEQIIDLSSYAPDCTAKNFRGILSKLVGCQRARAAMLARSMRSR